jgi:RNA polymerase sigma-70 factor (ECF subfamily)
VTAALSHTDQNVDLDAELARHRPALTGYCYRMLGSAFEAEDAVQETLLRAWRGIDRFEGRSSFKSWLYRIATNVCFDLLDGRRRRALPMDLSAPSPASQPVGPPATEVLWLQPIPDGRVVAADDPAEMVAASETIRLAFVAALQHLEPRPRAVLVLRDVLAWQATEVAELLGMTPTSVHSMLRRARATVAAHRADAPSDSVVDEALLARYVEAFEHFDIEALVALLHHDATFSMPPHPQWLRGASAIREWWLGYGAACRGIRMVPTAANGGPALALYRPAVDGGYEAFAIQVVETTSGTLAGIHSFIEPGLFPLFGLPSTLD